MAGLPVSFEVSTSLLSMSAAFVKTSLQGCLGSHVIPATLVDILGTMALLTINPLKPGVSIDINVNYLSAAKLGETLLLEGRFKSPL